MAAFEYLALDAAGRSKRGVLTGDSSRQVRSQLRTRGFFPIEVHVVEEAAGGQRRNLFNQDISPANLALITRQLATLLRAGIPLEESLRAMGRQNDKRRLQTVLVGVRSRITDGAPLHEAMAGYPGIFPELYRVMVEAGEASGRLEEILDRLADYTEARQALRQKLSMALIYPIMVTIVAMLVIIVMLTYVIPEVIRVFEQSGRSRYALLGGLALAWAVATRYAEGVFLPVFGLLLLVYLRRRSKNNGPKAYLRPVAAFAAPIAAVGLGLMSFNYARYGNPLNTGYLPQETFSAVWWQGIAGQLVSPGRGLLLYNPLLQEFSSHTLAYHVVFSVSPCSVSVVGELVVVEEALRQPVVVV